jgi:LysM repeat protein
MDFLDYVKMCQEDSGQDTRREKSCKGVIYKVEEGDTLYSISRKYDLRVRDLMKTNPFVDVYNLQIGEELCIPVMEETPGEGLRPYVVKQGDTIQSILQENGLTFEKLAELNKSVAALRLPVGTILMLPSLIQPRQ